MVGFVSVRSFRQSAGSKADTGKHGSAKYRRMASSELSIDTIVLESGMSDDSRQLESRGQGGGYHRRWTWAWPSDGPAVGSVRREHRRCRTHIIAARRNRCGSAEA